MTDAEFEKYKKQIYRLVSIELEELGENLPTPEELLSAAQKSSAALSKSVSDAEFQRAFDFIRANFTVQMEGSEAFIERGKHKPWVDSARSSLDWFFWKRYEKYLTLNKNWTPLMVSALGVTSDRILDFFGDPRSGENFSRRGLIIGGVQSGKTANYTALCCKAADAGYKVIIVLTGTLEDLRRQTQERLDFEFTGIDSDVWTLRRRKKYAGVGRYGSEKQIAQFTSAAKDFDRNKADTAVFLDNITGTSLFVVKKNSRILKNLRDWLKSSREGGSYPLLLIDDEADNASIDTSNGNDPTAVNGLIRSILNLFARTTYVGVTATPFANIFINPDSENEMLGDDLFPSDFIYALDVPSSYIGPDKIFGGGADFQNMVVPIAPEDSPDVENYFPAKHRKDLEVKELPPSLYEALNYFLLANAARDIRGDTKTHRTMLIHVSRFTAVHRQIYNLVIGWLDRVKKALDAYSNFGSSCYIEALREVFDKFGFEKICGVSWKVMLRDYLYKAAAPVTAGLRNSTKENPFSYSGREDGLRVIAVGGNSFSRGLTLEGLCVTYFYRSAGFYDTLMQMGRWFGYRPNYGDLCRLWISQELADAYGYITDELKGELASMQVLGKTPEDFGLKVRRYPHTLEITARNKMRAAVNAKIPVELSRILIETPKLPSSAEDLAENETLVRNFVSGLGKPAGGKKFLWRGVPKNEISRLIGSFKVSRGWQRSFQGDMMSVYIDNKMDGTPWDVLIPEGSGGTEFEISAGLNVKPLERKILVKNGEIQISGSKLRVGTPGVVRAGLTEDEIAAAEKNFHSLPGSENKAVPDNAYMICGRPPILVLYAVHPKTAAQSGVPEIIFALGAGFPAASDDGNGAGVKTAEYYLNPVSAKQFTQADFEEDLEE